MRSITSVIALLFSICLVTANVAQDILENKDTKSTGIINVNSTCGGIRATSMSVLGDKTVSDLVHRRGYCTFRTQWPHWLVELWLRSWPWMATALYSHGRHHYPFTLQRFYKAWQPFQGMLSVYLDLWKIWWPIQHPPNSLGFFCDARKLMSAWRCWRWWRTRFDANLWRQMHWCSKSRWLQRPRAPLLCCDAFYSDAHTSLRNLISTQLPNTSPIPWKKIKATCS